VVGPKIPDNFYEELKEKEEMQKEAQKSKDLLL